jgi:hypothetical protein
VPCKLRRFRRDSIPAQWQDFWLKLADRYAGADLTFEEDRFPAIAVIARELQRNWNDVYIAGCRLSLIIRQPALQVYASDSRPALTLRLHQRTRAPPTWSWVTCGRPLRFAPIYHEEAELVTYSVTLADESSPFGRVLEA